MALSLRTFPGVAAVRDRSEPVVRNIRPILAAVVDRIRPVARTVTALGWGVLALGTMCWVVGWRCGWAELMVIAASSWLLVLACSLLTLGRARLDVRLLADPQRVVVGARAAGAVQVRNISRTPLLPIGLELPIGPSAVRYLLPLLTPGADHEELFIVPTERRGVVRVGPALTVRGDPLGLLRRTVAWTTALEIFVHPITVRLEPLGAGLLRDLEGQSSNDISMSDLAFHALRDYAPGDDRRFIHWRSSAKAGRFLVRQFLDTRRSHVCVVVDGDAASYTEPDDFELAISIGASIAVRTLADEQQVTVLAADHASPRGSGQRLLDTFSRAELGAHGIADLARRANRITPDASLAVLISGAEVTFVQLQRAANEFPVEVRVVVLQVDPAQATSIRTYRRLTMLTLERLVDLAPLLAEVLS